MSCRCCGIATTDAKCVVCREICNREHGDRLQRRLERQVAAGQITAYHAIAASMLDDALLTGRLQIIPPSSEERARGEGASLWIAHPVPRWHVVASRAMCRGELPAIGEVVEAALWRHMGTDATNLRRLMIEQDLTEALTFIDADVHSVDVDITRDVTDPEHLIIQIKKRVNVEPGARVTAPDVEIPPDILARPRGQA